MKNKSKSKPPRTGERLLKRFLKEENRNHRIGDFEESFNYLLVNKNRLSALSWYWLQVIGSIPYFINNSIYWSCAMLKNYVTVALRNLRRYKTYSFINISGLALGMACCILISLYVQYELSYDNFHEKADQIYRLADPFSAAISSAPLPVALQKEIPEIRNFVRIYASKIWRDKELVSSTDKQFYTNRFFLADPSLFEIFTFPFIKGNPKTALSDLRSIVMTEEMAVKFFGDEEPLGKVLTFENRFDFIVTGVIKNIPSNAHFYFDFVAPLENNTDFNSNETWHTMWDNSAFVTYFLLPENYDVKQIEEKIPEIIEKNTGREYKSSHFLQPLQEIHLHSNLGKELEVNGDMRYVQVFTAVALLILIIACMNFINLATARSVKRSLEVGVRKVLGAHRSQLIRQFLGESLIISLLALGIALMLVWISLPFFNNILGTRFNYHPFGNVTNIIILCAVWTFTGLIAGSFPASILSTFKPVSVLKGKIFSKKRGFLSFRSSLVIFQYTIAIGLIVSTGIIINQLRYIQNAKLGFDKEQIAVIPVGRNSEAVSKVEILKNEIKKNVHVINVTASLRTPGRRPFWRNIRITDAQEAEAFSIQSLPADHDFLKTYKMELLAGRDFSKERSLDNTSAFILNETAIRMLGLKSPEDAVGKRVNCDRREGEIIGVVEDYHFVSLHTQIAPMAISIQPGRFAEVSVRIATDEVPSALASFKKSWEQTIPDRPFDYYFLNEKFSGYYQSDMKVEKLITYFTLLSIFITCLGLLGLVSFTAEQRKKEIGIRKVLGSSLTGIMVLLIKDFVKWVFVASIISWPIAYLAMNKWLQSFAYRIDIGIWIFLISAVFTILIAFLTVSYQSVKAATANPVESLRYE